MEKLLGAGAPRGDLADPAGVEGASGIDPQVDDPQQRDQGVDRGGALVGDVVAGGDQDPQGGPGSLVGARQTQLGVVEREGCLSDPASVQGVGLAHAAVGASVHPWCLGHGVPSIGSCTRQAGAVGADALDDPERVEVRAGAACDPGDGTGKAGSRRWELCLIEDLSGRAGQHGECMGSGVGVYADDEWAGVRDDRHGDRRSFLVTGM